MFGIKGMFKKYFDLDVIIGGEELNKEYLHNPNYSVYTSRGIAPRGLRGKTFVRNKLTIVLPKQADERVLDGTLGAMFYIVDNASRSVTIEDADDPLMWEYVLQRFIFRKPELVLNCTEKVHRHIHSNIKQYVNNLTQKILKRNDIIVDDIFDLLDYFNKNYVDKLTHTDPNSMYDKELTTLRHAIYPIVEDIYKLAYGLMSLGDDATETRVKDKLYKIPKTKIEKVIKLGLVNTASVANDCYLFGVTNLMVPQDKASVKATTRKKKGGDSKPNELLHSSQVEVCSIRMMSKSEPTSRGCLNPFVRLTENRRIEPNPEFEDRIKELDDRIKQT